MKGIIIIFILLFFVNITVKAQIYENFQINYALQDIAKKIKQENRETKKSKKPLKIEFIHQNGLDEILFYQNYFEDLMQDVDKNTFVKIFYYYNNNDIIFDRVEYYKTAKLKNKLKNYGQANIKIKVKNIKGCQYEYQEYEYHQLDVTEEYFYSNYYVGMPPNLNEFYEKLQIEAKLNKNDIKKIFEDSLRIQVVYYNRDKNYNKCIIKIRKDDFYKLYMNTKLTTDDTWLELIDVITKMDNDKLVNNYADYLEVIYTKRKEFDEIPNKTAGKSNFLYQIDTTENRLKSFKYNMPKEEWKWKLFTIETIFEFEKENNLEPQKYYICYYTPRDNYRLVFNHDITIWGENLTEIDFFYSNFLSHSKIERINDYGQICYSILIDKEEKQIFIAVIDSYSNNIVIKKILKQKIIKNK